MNIFDRWGEKLFTASDIHNAWDGMYKGILCKEDAYTWKINLTNVFGKSKELTGHVTLIK
jgi:gliding motility-associated-like protein